MQLIYLIAILVVGLARWFDSTGLVWLGVLLCIALVTTCLLNVLWLRRTLVCDLV